MTASSSALALRPAQIPAFSIEVLSADRIQWAQELDSKLEQAPQMLREAGLLLSLDKYPEHLPRPDLAVWLELLRARELRLLAVRGLRHDEQERARELGLLCVGATTPLRETPSQPVTAPARASLLIEHAVRSGQQIYAEGCDLIITATVNAGAEVVADGHIHVYAPLRGRALAGVSGDEQARIFCRHMEAELIAIAGRYLTAESLQEHALSGSSVQVQLRGDQLHIAAL